MSSPGPDIACSVCYNSFDVSLRKPIDLGCGHTFCDSCISAHPTSFHRISAHYSLRVAGAAQNVELQPTIPTSATVCSTSPRAPTP
ncbi:hypothetical protein V8C86DRAFT_2491533 [Haematococcus lacustris]